MYEEGIKEVIGNHELVWKNQGYRKKTNKREIKEEKENKLK